MGIESRIADAEKLPVVYLDEISSTRPLVEQRRVSGRGSMPPPGGRVSGRVASTCFDRSGAFQAKRNMHRKVSRRSRTRCVPRANNETPILIDEGNFATWRSNLLQDLIIKI
jgi:hypothetical protein